MFTNVWGVFKLLYFEDDFYVYLQISQKETKENTNFDELPKMNSRIKITTIKIMRFKIKVLKRTFKNINQEVLQCLQKTKLKYFMLTLLLISNKEATFLASKLLV